MYSTISTKIGDRFSGRARTVTLERINFFSGGYPRGENWPAKNIHTDLEAAEKCGLKSRAASGAMFEGYLIDLMIDTFGDAWRDGGKMSLVFINIVAENDVITPYAEVKEVRRSESDTITEMDLWCDNQRGEKVVVGTASVNASV